MVISEEQLKAILLEAKVLDQTRLDEIVRYAHNSQINLTDALLEKDILSDEKLGILIADALKIPFIVLAKVSIPEEVFRIIPERIARKYKVIPFSRDAQGIKIATADPANKLVQEMISQKTGQKVFVYLATERDIYGKLWVYRKDLQKTFDGLVAEQLRTTRQTGAIEAPIAKIVDLIINYGYQDRASDVHIEPEEKDTLVRFRVDGILHDVLFLPKKLHEQIVTRIKVLSSLRTDEHLTPQDGKMRVPLEEEDLGMNQSDLEKITRAFTKSYGMILSTGPTGSGKTTSIYAILKIINTREKNITTIEDPVEYRIKGVNQIQTNQRTDLTFANGLRSILRQDPNVIFVGEIRDSETAGIAVNAALTGHLVLSTLHTNDAATALPRLVDMKVEPFLVASTVTVIVAQRLVRKICEMCKVSEDFRADELLKNFPADAVKRIFGMKKEIRVYKGQGCSVCHKTGYAGRVGVFEVLEISNAIRQLINEKNDADVIIAQAIKEGMTTMLDDGLDKVVKGVTTIEEVLRVTKVETL